MYDFQQSKTRIVIIVACMCVCMWVSAYVRVGAWFCASKLACKWDPILKTATCENLKAIAGYYRIPSFRSLGTASSTQDWICWLVVCCISHWAWWTRLGSWSTPFVCPYRRHRRRNRDRNRGRLLFRIQAWLYRVNIICPSIFVIVNWFHRNKCAWIVLSKSIGSTRKPLF